MRAAPRVSVLMPVRNGLPWLRDALDSLSRQTLEDIELIVLEDGSTDGTPDVLASWPDKRLKVIRTGGLGIGGALNVGLAAARAPFVARQDADDISAPERLDAQFRYLLSRCDIGVLGTVADYIDADGRPLDNEWIRTIRRQQDVACKPEDIRALMPLTCCITHGSIMGRTSLLRAAGGYRPEMSPSEDYDLWLRLLGRTRIAKLPERLYRYRVHGEQASARASGVQLLNALRAKLAYVRRAHPDLPTGARLVVVGSGRGAACYRALAPAHGFRLVAPPPAFDRHRLDLLADRTVRHWMLDTCDAVVVPNFADLDAYAEAFGVEAADAQVVRVGNFFIPMRRVGRRAA